MRVVLDTNQIIGAGTRWLGDGQSHFNNNIHRRILVAIALSHTGLYCSKIIGEYLEKLVDKKHPHERAIKLIAYIMGSFENVQIVTQNAPCIPTDPDDEIFLICAVDGHADYLISEDHSLLDLKAFFSNAIIGCAADFSVLLGV
jgi:uncharacterized protein